MGAMKRSKENDHNARERKASKDKVSFEETRFVRIELSEAEKVEFRELYAGGEYADVGIDDWLDQGYKLSLSRDGKGGGVIASLTGQYRNMLNAGLVLTGRGSSASVALGVLRFKDNVLADETGWAACEAQRGGSYDEIG